MEYYELIEILQSLARDYVKLVSNPNTSEYELDAIKTQIIDIENQIKQQNNG
jgi:hypothetical protein